MLVIKTQQQIGTPAHMNISYINKEVCRLFDVKPDDDLCAAPKIATEYKPKNLMEFAQKLEIRMFWAWDNFTLYILYKVYELGIVARGGCVTPLQLLTTVKNHSQNTPLNPALNLGLSKLFAWFNSRSYLLRAA